MLFEDRREKLVLAKTADVAEFSAYPTWLNIFAATSVLLVLGSFVIGAFTEDSLLGITFVVGWFGVWITTRFAKKFRSID